MMMAHVDVQLQERILSAAPTLEEDSPTSLVEGIRATLLNAWENGLLVGGQEVIYQNVKITGDRTTYAITGGIKDFSRSSESARLIRDDGAWIHFTITVEWKSRRSLHLIAYDFEIVFGDGRHPKFFRFDFNPPGHANELRCHCHPGNDDYLAPAPVMTPSEILSTFTAGMRARDLDRPRA